MTAWRAPKHTLGGAIALVERNAVYHRHYLGTLVSGFTEPLVYLAALGFGLGRLVAPHSAHLHGVGYAAFVAPGLAASTAMSGAVLDSTFNTFHKLRIAKTYATTLATPLSPQALALGETAWATIRGTMHATVALAAIVILHLSHSALVWVTLAAVVLVAYAFSGLGLAMATLLRSWQDFDLMQLVLMPLFLFSGVFFPLAGYPARLRPVVEASPLFWGVDLIRSLCLGGLHPAHACLEGAGLVLVGTAGVAFAGHRLSAELLA